MQNDNRNPKLKLSDGLYRLDHPDSDLFLSRPVRSTSTGDLGNDVRYMREVFVQSHKPNESDFTNKPNEYRELDGSYTYTVATTVCPTVRSDSGFITSTIDNNNFQHVCPNNPLRTCNCSGPCADKDFEPTDSPAKGEGEFSGGPCVVVGDYTETGNNSIQPIPTGENGV